MSRWVVLASIEFMMLWVMRCSASWTLNSWSISPSRPPLCRFACDYIDWIILWSQLSTLRIKQLSRKNYTPQSSGSMLLRTFQIFPYGFDIELPGCVFGAQSSYSYDWLWAKSASNFSFCVVTFNSNFFIRSFLLDWTRNWTWFDSCCLSMPCV